MAAASEKVHGWFQVVLFSLWLMTLFHVVGGLFLARKVV